MKYGLGLVTVLALLASGCGDGGSEPENAARRCTRMRDRLIELRLASTELRSGTSFAATNAAHATTSADLRAQHRAALETSLGADFAERCARTMTVAQIDCVIGAADRESADACIANR